MTSGSQSGSSVLHWVRAALTWRCDLGVLIGVVVPCSAEAQRPVGGHGCLAPAPGCPSPRQSQRQHDEGNQMVCSLTCEMLRCCTGLPITEELSISQTNFVLGRSNGTTRSHPSIQDQWHEQATCSNLNANPRDPQSTQAPKLLFMGVIPKAEALWHRILLQGGGVRCGVPILCRGCAGWGKGSGRHPVLAAVYW